MDFYIFPISEMRKPKSKSNHIKDNWWVAKKINEEWCIMVGVNQDSESNPVCNSSRQVTESVLEHFPGCVAIMVPSVFCPKLLKPEQIEILGDITGDSE